MALKNLFDMVKADRYTADGREELIKAQEAETEDKVYQIGEISQKTGLQKTANGWVKPKNGKQPGAKNKPDKVGDFMKAYERGDFGKFQQNAEQRKVDSFFNSAKKKSAAAGEKTEKENVKSRAAASKINVGSDVKVKVNGGRTGKVIEKRGDLVTVEMPASGSLPARRDQYYESDLELNSDKWQKNTDYLGRERISMETPQGGKVSIYESENPKQKNARFRVDTGDHYNEFNTMEEAKAFAEEHFGRASKPAAGSKSAASNVPHNFSQGDRYKNKYGENIDISETDEDTIVYTKTNVDGSRETHEMPAAKFKSMLEGEEFTEGSNTKAERMRLRAEMGAEDSAPRVLTGDTRIRVRRPRPLPRKRELTGDTRIRLSQIVDLLTWRLTRDKKDQIEKVE